MTLALDPTGQDDAESARRRELLTELRAARAEGLSVLERYSGVPELRMTARRLGSA